MKIQVGKKYVTRDGDTVTIQLSGSDYDRRQYPFYADENATAYARSGKYFAGARGNEEHPYDIVREYQPEAASEIQSQTSDTSLPEDDSLRADFPMFDGLLAYFPNALAAVAEISKYGSEKHNPGEPMYWNRGKSTNHLDKVIRHAVDAGKKDTTGRRHSAYLAWRALANLQTEIEEQDGVPMSRGSKKGE